MVKGVYEARMLRGLAVNQLFALFDFGLIVTELAGDDLHSTGDFLFQTGLVLTINASLAAGGPLDATEVIGLV
jgi:hypothetical protein